MDIRLVKSRISFAMRGRRGDPLDLAAQNSLKPRRCQRITVSGCTKIRALIQLDQTSESNAHKMRSTRKILGRLCSHLKVASCCR